MLEGGWGGPVGGRDCGSPTCVAAVEVELDGSGCMLEPRSRCADGMLVSILRSCLETVSGCIIEMGKVSPHVWFCIREV